jgi:hypothetical protein
LGRTLCILKTLLVVLPFATAIAATLDSNSQPVTTGIRHYLMPDRSFKSVFSLDLVPVEPGAAVYHIRQLPSTVPF